MRGLHSISVHYFLYTYVANSVHLYWASLPCPCISLSLLCFHLLLNIFTLLIVSLCEITSSRLNFAKFSREKRDFVYPGADTEYSSWAPVFQNCFRAIWKIYIQILPSPLPSTGPSLISQEGEGQSAHPTPFDRRWGSLMWIMRELVFYCVSWESC